MDKQEKRKSTRLAVKLPFQLYANSAEEEFSIAFTHNISKQGILFETKTVPPVSNTLAMKLDLPHINQVIRCQMRVVHIEQDNERGVYLVGCRFENLSAKCSQAIITYVKNEVDALRGLSKSQKQKS